MRADIASHGAVHEAASFRFFFSSRRRHTRWPRDWSSDVCSSDFNNEINSFLQFILLVGLLLLCFWMYILLKNRLHIFTQIALMILLIMVLNISIYLIQHFLNSLWTLNVTVLLN